jgi:ADP-ribose pyrophosphatase YjhB (NUDIX family)
LSDADVYIVNVEAFVYRDGKYLMIVRGLNEEIQPGTLTPPGGKVEGVRDVLEETLRREVREETGVEVDDEVVYVESHAFDGGDRVVVDIIFLARYREGELRAVDADEVDSIGWFTLDEVMADPRALSWTRESLRRADRARKARGW